VIEKMKTKKKQTPVPVKTSYSERAPNSDALLALFRAKAAKQNS
jgi:hypothetical protein